MIQKKYIATLIFGAIFLFYGCASYYQKSYEFHQDFAAGNLDAAKSFLEKNAKADEKKDRLLYFLDRGVVEQMLGSYTESNFYFEEAYLYYQEYQNNLGSDLLGMIANPMLKPYKAEDFETVLIHYYKAINYIHLADFDAAMVEIRRINIRLNEINDKNKDKNTRYKQDAFALNLMGIIYETKGDINNAFIAYRNAYESYDSLYSQEFNVEIPFQLKKDLLRTASKLGFRQEIDQYEKEFNLKADSYKKETGDMIFFWMNGLGPVKGEFSLNLSTISNGNGFFTFANETEGINIPYNTSESYNANQSSDFSDLKFVRMAVPKYRKRSPYFQSATLVFDSLPAENTPLYLAENIEAIAISSLKDRMLREISKSIGRLAIKQAAEQALRSENEDLGSVLSILNAVTEKADTRNWQTLPNSIHYSRVNLPVGKHDFSLITNSGEKVNDTTTFSVDIKSGKTVFKSFHSLESSAPQL
jgi:hypothetical protein